MHTKTPKQQKPQIIQNKKKRPQQGVRLTCYVFVFHLQIQLSERMLCWWSIYLKLDFQPRYQLLLPRAITIQLSATSTITVILKFYSRLCDRSCFLFRNAQAFSISHSRLRSIANICPDTQSINYQFFFRLHLSIQEKARKQYNNNNKKK